MTERETRIAGAQHALVCALRVREVAMGASVASRPAPTPSVRRCCLDASDPLADINIAASAEGDLDEDDADEAFADDDLDELDEDDFLADDEDDDLDDFFVDDEDDDF